MTRLLYRYRIASVFVFTIITIPVGVAAQALNWTNIFRGAGTDAVYGVAFDGIDNTYFGGAFQADLDFAPPLNSVGLSDGFVAKIGSGGNVLWRQQISGTENESVLDVAADGAANCYATGVFVGTSDFSGTIKVDTGGGDVFVARYTPGGALLWVNTFGGLDLDFGNSITVHDDAVYVTGEFTDSITVDGNTIVGAGGADVFVVCYDTTGAFTWAVSAGASTNDQGHGIATDASGNVYVAGAYSSTASFGGMMTSSLGSFDAFIAKYDNTGAIQWVRSAGGSELDRAYDVAVSASGIVYATGQFWGSATFDTDVHNSGGGFDVFLWAVNTSGVLVGSAIGGGSEDDIGLGVAVDGSNNVLLTGEFHKSMTFGGASNGNNTIASRGANDAFLIKIAPGFVYNWSVSGGGSEIDIGRSVTTGGSHVYLGGQFSGVARFQNNNMPSLGGFDAFMAKYDCDYAVPVRSAPAGVLSLMQNIPNPFGVETSIVFRVAARERVQVSVYDVAGRHVRTLIDEMAVPDVDHTVRWDGRTTNGSLARSGVYFYRLTTPTATTTRKMVVMR